MPPVILRRKDASAAAEAMVGKMIPKRENKGAGETGRSFLHGALILTVGMMMVKVIGALFKIPLKYAIGEYGMGLFNVAYNFYGPVFSLATAGFPVAVSRMVSESRSLRHWNDVRQIKRVAFPLFFTLGGAGMLLLTLIAPVYCGKLIDTPYALAPVLALAPAILFACLGSVYRGYYEGLQNMSPTALSQVVEAFVKLGLGLFAGRWAVSACTEEYARFGTVFSLRPESADEALFLSLSFGAAGAVLGVTVGSLAALCYLALRHRLGGDGIDPRLYRISPAPASRKATSRRLLSITVPVALGAVATNVTGLIDATFLQSRLSGILERFPERLLRCFPGMIPEMYLEHPETVPTYLYGCYTLAMTIYLLVPALTQTIGVSALPSVTEVWARGDRQEIGSRIRSVSRVTALFSFPAGLGITALSEPIVRVLYGDTDSAPIVAGVLTLLGIASLAAAMCAPLSSMLQAVGRADLPVKLLCCAMILKLLTNWLLCGIPELNIYGAAFGTLTCYLFLMISQFLCLRRESGADLPARELFLRPLLCAVLCGLSANTCFWGLRPLLPAEMAGEALGLGISVISGAGIYLLGLFLLGGEEFYQIKILIKPQKIRKTA